MTKMTAAEVRAAAARRHYQPKILDNADRGDIAEEIVAALLEPDWKYCGGAWAGWDFEHRSGTRLQLKQSAARQSWTSKKVRMPSFNIKWQTGHWKNGVDWTPAATPTRYSQIYIFGWHGVTDETCDHADPAQWQFYVVPATKLPDKDVVTLAALKQMRRSYDEDTLAAAVEVARLNLGTTA